MPVSRRTFSKKFAAALATLTIPASELLAVARQSDSGISHTAEAIHLERIIQAPPARVYAALTDARRFDAVARLSDAMKSMKLKETPSVIGRAAGGAVALFGGYVTGWQVELVPDARIVQVWRSAGWKAGDYSLVKFTLVAQAAATRLVLDQTGFPDGDAEHLVEGWKGNYFAPLAKYLG